MTVELFHCAALKARISQRQCAINQGRAAVGNENGKWGYKGYLAVGLLHHCLDCSNPDKAGEVINMAPKKPAPRIKKENANTMGKKETQTDDMTVGRCPNHPDREVFRGRDGRKYKLCHECLKKNWKTAQRKRSSEDDSGAGLYLDFTGRENLLEAIKKTAAAEERTPAGQVIYWLKKHLGVAADNAQEKKP